MQVLRGVTFPAQRGLERVAAELPFIFVSAACGDVALDELASSSVIAKTIVLFAIALWNVLILSVVCIGEYAHTVAIAHIDGRIAARECADLI